MEKGELNEIHAPGASDASSLPLDDVEGPMHRPRAPWKKRGLHRKKTARFSEPRICSAVSPRRLLLVWSPLDGARAAERFCKALLLPRR